MIIIQNLKGFFQASGFWALSPNEALAWGFKAQARAQYPAPEDQVTEDDVEDCSLRQRVGRHVSAN